MQKYRVDEKWPPRPDGSQEGFTKWMGGPSLAVVFNCRLDNLVGDMRRTVYVTGEADTFFSIPAVCKIGGKRVRGYLTGDGDGSLVFRHVYY